MISEVVKINGKMLLLNDKTGQTDMRLAPDHDLHGFSLVF